MLSKTFSLTNADIEIMTFFYLLETSEIMKDDYNGIYIIDFSCVTVFRNYGDVLLGMKRDVFINSMASGNLFKAELLKKEEDRNSIEISPWCADYLSCMCDEDLTREFSAKGNDEILEVSDFDIHEDNLLVLDVLFKDSGRQNILLYGAAGTGKTSFARSLAKKYNRVLYTVKSPDTDDHKDRLRATFATVNLAEKDTSIILVDEADEILNSYNSIFFKSRTAKSWINQFLDSHDKKIIWITNRSSGIDPSTMRRFSFSIEFKNLNKKNRLKVLKHELEKSGVSDFLSDDELDDLCRTYNVDAGGIVNAINILNIASDINKETALRKVRAVLKNHEKATGRRIGNSINDREFSSWTFEGLNTSANLRDVVSALHLYDSRPHTKNLSIALLLYGLPGTGKSEFVYYLGHILGKEVLLKRASEIRSCWVGETEQNIAGAFAEAQETDSILFFDEADTFLFPRKSARQSWEISFTNEILTQLESFKGTVFFATNDMDGLDHAALRRFKFKIEFKLLTPEGNLIFYNTLLKRLASDSDLSAGEVIAIKDIKNLTPGDFAVVKDQMFFAEPASITHKMLIEALANEVGYKKTGKAIGF